MIYVALIKSMSALVGIQAIGAGLVLCEYLSNPKQRLQIFSGNYKTDLSYALLTVTLVLQAILATNALIFRFSQVISPGLASMHSFVMAQPMWLQTLEVLVLADFVYYWFHRSLLHGPLERVHAIHHSPLRLGWFSNFRFHPLELVLKRAFLGIPLVVVGFSNKAAGPYVFLFIVIGYFSHANLNWGFGIFKKVILSPLFHRIHHLAGDPRQVKNFSGLFPIWDVLFGTFWMPSEVRDLNELKLGGVNDMPEGLWRQTIYPFRRS